MKIGDFSKRFNISTSAVRYYVESDMLTPIRRNSQYIFTDANLLEMEYIMKLKTLSFSMSEIKSFLHIIRLYNIGDSKVNQTLVKLFIKKKNRLKKEFTEIKNKIELIDKETKLLMDANFSGFGSEGGFPYLYMNYLACPICNSDLNMENLEIRKGKVLNGKLCCDCGYEATIENGVIMTEPDTSYAALTDFHFDHYGYEEKYNDFIFFEYMEDISKEATALLLKCYAWMDLLLTSKNIEKKVLFLPDFSAHYLYKYINREYFRNTLIIISGASREFIDSIKMHIDTMQKDLDIMYIANATHLLPIKRGSIDLWIDAISSYNFSFYHSKMLHEYIEPYMSEHMSVVGLTKFLDGSSKSMKKIREIYKNCHKDNSKRTAFTAMLNNLGYNLEIMEEIGYTIEPGEYYDYMQKGEKHYYAGYFAQKRKI